MTLELGIYTFGDLAPDVSTGRILSGSQRMRQLLDIARLADEVGLDVLGVGEHHGLRYVNSATATMLSAMAAVTHRIRLTSASTLLTTADPVRVFQAFATADLVSEGRVEVMFGRGVSVDNYSLFGVDRTERDTMFTEKLNLFDRLNAEERVTWSGRYRPALEDAEIAPRPAQSKLPVWIAAASPTNVEQAAAQGYPVAMPLLIRMDAAIAHSAATAEHYRTAWSAVGRAKADVQIATCSFMQVSADPSYIEEEYFSTFRRHAAPIFGGNFDRSTYAGVLGRDGGLVAGNAQQVVEKILAIHEAVGDTRHIGHVDLGGQSFKRIAEAIELLGTVVAPAVRKYTRPTPGDDSDTGKKMECISAD